MKELVILSGKGGTGKTSVAGACITLAHRNGKKIVLADADVDAADLFLLTQPVPVEEEDFTSGVEAHITPELCTGCGRCFSVCRFDAIRIMENGKAQIAETGCEGSAVSPHVCPVHAIDLVDRHCGVTWTSDTRFGKMFHARLDPAGGNSGKLVTLVRQRAKEYAKGTGAEWLIVDGPPGIGCPVIASITDADAILTIAEPGLSSKHDLVRLLELARHFGIPTMLIVNKWDIDPDITVNIENEARQMGAIPVGRIPWSKALVEAQLSGRTLPEYLPAGDIQSTITEIWEKICQTMHA